MYTGWGTSEMVTHAVQSELKRLGLEIEHLSGEKIKKHLKIPIWAIYNDQTAGWSPQMVVNSKGILPKMALN